MTGETVSDLLTPLIGKSGSISMVVSGIGQIAFAMGKNKKLTRVEVRPDGLVRLERETGWTMIGPGEVVAVVWSAIQTELRIHPGPRSRKEPPVARHVGDRYICEKCGAVLVYEKECPCPAEMPHVEICCGEQMKLSK